MSRGVKTEYKRTSISDAPVAFIHGRFYTFGGFVRLQFKNLESQDPKERIPKRIHYTSIVGCLDLNKGPTYGKDGEWSIVGMFCFFSVENFD